LKGKEGLAMGNIFAASEVLEIAIQIEKNGRDFYNSLAVQPNMSNARDTFRYLAAQEEKHIEVFTGIMDKTNKYVPQGLDVGQYYDYMKALAGENVFMGLDKGLEWARSIKNDSEAIALGIKAEKDSIIFYEEIKRAVPEYERKIIDEVIAQEEGHLKMLMVLTRGGK